MPNMRIPRRLGSVCSMSRQLTLDSSTKFKEGDRVCSTSVQHQYRRKDADSGYVFHRREFPPYCWRWSYGERRGHRFFDAKLALKIVVYLPTVLAYLRKLTRLVVLRVWRWEVWHGGTSSSNNIFQFFWRRRRHVLLDIYKAISNIREDMLCQILSTV